MMSEVRLSSIAVKLHLLFASVVSLMSNMDKLLAYNFAPTFRHTIKVLLLARRKRRQSCSELFEA